MNPAKYFGLKDAGLIAEGSRADLVLLDANPLEDIRNTHKIAAVVVRGNYLSKQDLQEMLKNAANAAEAN